MNETNPDFTDHETWLIPTGSDDRWDKNVVVTRDVDLRLTAGARELTTCPAICRPQDECNFIVARTHGSNTSDARRYRSQFFYSVKDQFGTGIESYADLGEYILTPLRLQTDHASARQNNYPLDK